MLAGERMIFAPCSSGSLVGRSHPVLGNGARQHFGLPDLTPANGLLAMRDNNFLDALDELFVFLFRRRPGLVAADVDVRSRVLTRQAHG